MVINSIGGCLNTSLGIYDILREHSVKHKQHIITQVRGQALSGGALIMCAGDTIDVSEHSVVMFHRSRTNLAEDVYTDQYLEDQVAANTLFSRLAEDVVARHLTPQQLDRYRAGKDVYLTHEDF